MTRQAPTFRGVELRGANFMSRLGRAHHDLLGPSSGFTVRREPDNPADPLAVLACCSECDVAMAYVQRPVNMTLAVWMDRGWIYLGQVTGCLVMHLGRRVIIRRIATIYPIGGPREASRETKAKTKQPREALWTS